MTDAERLTALRAARDQAETDWLSGADRVVRYQIGETVVLRRPTADFLAELDRRIAAVESRIAAAAVPQRPARNVVAFI